MRFLCLRRSYTYRPFWTKLPKKNDKKYYYNKIIKIYCKCSLFWIKWAKAQVLKLILYSFIAFSRKKVCRSFSLRPHDGFSWDKEQIVHNLCSYGSKSCNFKVLICKYFFHSKNWFFCNNFFHFFEFLGFLSWTKYLYMKILKLQLLDP